MLHAFNQKNVRRFLLKDDAEHTIEKTEDAVTSMVFSPLAFMSPIDALSSLGALIGRQLDLVVAARTPTRHSFELWPGGLTARSWEHGKQSRCEPDLLVHFDFDEGPSLTVIGEFKWDWRMAKHKLARELQRERQAVQSSSRKQVQFVIAKYAPASEIDGVPVLSWTEVTRRLITFHRIAEAGAPRVWAEQIRTFLEKADLRAFAGFPQMSPVATWEPTLTFWKEQPQSTEFKGFPDADPFDWTLSATFWSSK